MNRLLTLSATEIAGKIKKGELTSEAAVLAHIDHIKWVNPAINAVVKDRFSTALEEARTADDALKKKSAKELPPFHGVPCTIKECFALTGMPNASGLVARKDVVSAHDAPAVGRLRNAGAIPLGVTNTSELCMWMESGNNVYGRTNNPYDTARIVGGSSGGEGAIVASGGSPFGLGSDIGGSIRMPAFFNGVFGHKPSGGLVPGTGQYPLASNEALRYLTTGPLARKAEDLWPLLRILAGPDGQDEGCEKMKLGDPYKVDIADLNVAVVKENGAIGVTPDMRDALLNAAGILKDVGARVEMVEFPELRHSRDIWASMLSSAGGPTFSELMGAGEPIPAFTELGKWMFRRSDHTLPAIGLAIIEKAATAFPERTKRFVALGDKLKGKIENRLGDNGIMLYPSYPSPAPLHHVPLLRPFKWVYTGILNVMQMAVTQVPMGLNEIGLPLGVQVAANRGNDHLTVAVAMEVERRAGGWVRPGFDYLPK